MASPPPSPAISLIGLGAIGILYADRIEAAAPGALTVIADPARIARYRADPPAFNDRPLNLRYLTPDEPAPPADLVLIAVKSNGLADSLTAIRSHVGAHTQILPLLNGITAQDAVAAAYGWHRTLHGFVYCDSAMREGNRVIQSGKSQLVFGEAANRPPSPRVQAVAQLLTALDIPHKVPDDMIAAQWRKYILNVGINQAQAVYRATCGQLHANPGAMKFARDLMDEAAAIGAALGVAGVASLPQWAEGVILAAAPDNKTSMLQDVLANRPTEVDLFAQTLVRLGQKHNIPTPANQRVIDTLLP